MAGVRQKAVGEISKTAGPRAARAGWFRAVQEIRKHLEAAVIPKTRRNVRISRGKCRSCKSRLLKHRSQRAFLRRNTQHIAPERQRIARGKHWRHRIVSRRPRGNCIFEDHAFLGETIQKRRSWALVPKKAHMVRAKAIDRNKD